MIGLLLVSLLLAGGLLFAGLRVPALTLLILLPWLFAGLALRTPGLFRFSPKSGGPFSILIPAAVLLIADSTNDLLLEWPWVLVPLLIAVALTRLIAADRNVKRAQLSVLFVWSLMYGAGAMHVLNSQLDADPGQTHRARVMSKEANRSSLTVASWGPRSSPSIIRVPVDLYAGTNPGDIVCFQLYRGALRIPWFEVGPCSLPVE